MGWVGEWDTVHGYPSSWWRFCSDGFVGGCYDTIMRLVLLTCPFLAAWIMNEIGSELLMCLKLIIPSS